MSEASKPGPGPVVDAAAATTGASVLGGGLWQMASRLLPQFTTLVLSIAVARFLGPDGFGRQSFIAFIAISATTFFSGGLKVAVMRYVGELLGRRENASVRALVFWAGSIQVAGAILGGGVLVATGLLGAKPQAAWALAGIGAAAGIVQTIPFASLLGMQRFRAPAVIGLTTTVVSIPSTIGVLALGGGITGIFAVEAAIAIANLSWTAIAARGAMREVAPGARLHVETLSGLWKPFLRYASITTAGTVVQIVVWRRSEFFFLEHYSTDAEVGLYSIAFAATYAVALIPQTLASVIAPAFATLFGAGDEQRLRSGYQRATRLLVIGSLPITAAGLALGPAAIRLVYGDAYERAGPVLLVMIALFPLIPLFEVSESLLVGLRRPWVPLAFGVVAAAIDIALAFVLVPRFDAVGAALANTGAQIALIVPVAAYTARLAGGLRLHMGSVLRTAAASAGGALTAWSLLQAVGGIVGFVVATTAGAVAFSILAAALCILPGEDARWLDAVAGERFGGAVGRTCRVLSRDRLA